jgi:hypothetical protein
MEHMDRGADAPAPLPDGSYPLTPAEEAQQTDSPPVKAYLLTNARRQGAICSWSGDDHGWLSVAHEDPSFLGVFRL